MPKIQNNFLQGIINKDLDERLVPNGQLTDAVNFMVSSEENGNKGVGKPVYGNAFLNSLVPPQGNQECIGGIADEGKERLFIFLTGDEFDYVLKYDTVTNTSTIILQDTKGRLLNFSKDYRISHANLFVSVEDSDLLSWTDGLNPPRIINTERIYPLDGFTESEISVMKPAPRFAPNISQLQVVSNPQNLESNELEDRFISFAYRWKYQDGYYSSFSPFSEYYFVPQDFSFDFNSMENEGMVNFVKNYNVEFNSGGVDVIGIDVLFKYEGLPNVYVLNKFIKEDEGWLNNTLYKTQFSNNKKYSVLPESQWFRSFDNVPLTALTQERVGNRLVYGNFIEGRNMVDEDGNKVIPRFDVSLVSTNVDRVPISEPFNALRDFTFTFPDNFEFKSGESFQLNITVGFNTQPSDYTFERFIFYTIEQDFTDFSDFMANSAFVGLIENDLSSEFDDFIDNATPFKDKSNYVGFSVTDDGVSEVNIEAPSFDYDLNGKLDFTTSTSIPNFDLTDDFLDYNGFTVANQSRTLVRINVQHVNIGVPFIVTIFKDGVFDRDYYSVSNGLEQSFQVFNDTTNATALRGEYTFHVTNQGSDFKAKVTEQIFITIFGNTTSTTGFAETNDPATFASAATENFESLFVGNNIAEISVGGLRSSMKSNRSYEVGIIWRDKEGRKTTAFTPKENTLYIPQSNSATKNRLKVTFPNNFKHPEWADNYKFVIRQNRLQYQTIYAITYFNDEDFIWVKLDGESKNKVKENDDIIIKKDRIGVLSDLVRLKVLEVKEQDKDFLGDDYTYPDGTEALVPSGLYMKIDGTKAQLIPNSSDILKTAQISPFLLTTVPSATAPFFSKYEAPSTIDTEIKAGSLITLTFGSFSTAGRQSKFEKTYVIKNNYANSLDWWNDKMLNEDFIDNNGDNYKDKVTVFRDASDNNVIKIRVIGLYSGGGGGINVTQFGCIVTAVLVNSDNLLVFETEPKIENQDIYFETPETYLVSNGLTEHILSRTYNCFTFGNGVESNRYKDRFNATPFYIDFFPTSVSEDEYRQIDRYADLTWSGVYQESTNVNRLNEFNLSLANFKDDLEKKYGSIIRLDGDETDLMVIQEDRTSKVLYQKDLLYNADATTNLSRIEQVFGQQVMYAGDYGISTHPESYADYATNSFWVDVNRGVVIRFNSSNGLFPISKFGLNEYFRELFRDRVITNIIAEYDAFYDLYLLNIKMSDGYETWVYSPDNNGWLCRQTFNPQKMIRLNNKLFSINEDGLWEHNVGLINTFYNVYSDSSFAFNFSQEPSTRKIFKTISIEGDAGWNMNLTTDLQTGYINSNDFIRKEGVFFSHIRGNEWNVDFANKSVVGLGNLVSVLGNTIRVVEVSNQVSIGDRVYNQNGLLVGTINDINGLELTLNTTNNLTPNIFLVAVKNASVETSGLVGYYMNVQCSASPNNLSTVFAINTDISKSFE